MAEKYVDLLENLDGGRESAVPFSERTWNPSDSHDWSSISLHCYECGCSVASITGSKQCVPTTDDTEESPE